jgi:hypothetical protein
MGVGDHSRTKSNVELDPRDYKLLVELMDRLDAKFAEKRKETKEDIDAAIKTGLAPIEATLTAVNDRLQKGEERFKEQDKRELEQDKRIDGQSDLLKDALSLVKSHKANCPVAKSNQAQQTQQAQPSTLSKIGTTIVLPLVIAALSPLFAIWIMVQLKLVAFADLTTKPLPAVPAATTP